PPPEKARPKPTDVIGNREKPENLREAVWNDVKHDVAEFGVEHDRTRAKKELTTEDISGKEMFEIVHEAVLRVKDPSDALVSAKIYVVDEQLKGKNEDAQKAAKRFGIDDKYKEEDIIAAIQGASDEHLAQSWTSVAATPVGGGPTMKQTYGDFQNAFEIAK